eukprot:3912862-Rhodomonas_salina.3
MESAALLPSVVVEELGLRHLSGRALHCEPAPILLRRALLERGPARARHAPSERRGREGEGRLDRGGGVPLERGEVQCPAVESGGAVEEACGEHTQRAPCTAHRAARRLRAARNKRGVAELHARRRYGPDRTAVGVRRAPPHHAVSDAQACCAPDLERRVGAGPLALHVRGRDAHVRAALVRIAPQPAGRRHHEARARVSDELDGAGVDKRAQLDVQLVVRGSVHAHAVPVGHGRPLGRRGWEQDVLGARGQKMQVHHPVQGPGDVQAALPAEQEDVAARGRREAGGGAAVGPLPDQDRVQQQPRPLCDVESPPLLRERVAGLRAPKEVDMPEPARHRVVETARLPGCVLLLGHNLAPGLGGGVELVQLVEEVGRRAAVPVVGAHGGRHAIVAPKEEELSAAHGQARWLDCRCLAWERGQLGPIPTRHVVGMQGGRPV